MGNAFRLLLLSLCLCLSFLSDGTQDNSITHPAEVRALQAIRKELVDPLKNLQNWTRGDPCTSNWTGIVCYNKTMKDGYLHVKELELLRMNLSGTLSTELGRLSFLKILDFMWNNIGGSIPKEIGNIKSLELLLLNGNLLTGPLPEELGYLPNLDRIQIDQNNISGPIPVSFAYLNKTKHFHMNNNSISGQIPPELSRLPKLVHFLLDNNKLSGYLPPEFSKLPSLLILQLDNNDFNGRTIPASYGNMSKLLKLSMRNCGLRGPIPDLSKIVHLGYLDLSLNKLSGPLPQNRLSNDITTILLSNNSLTGHVPASFSGLPRLQMLSLANNRLNGSLISTIWQNNASIAVQNLTLDFENNALSSISGTTDVPLNVTLLLKGNPLCSNANTSRFCNSSLDDNQSQNIKNMPLSCPSQACPPDYMYAPTYPVPCFCAAPLLVMYRLKSPGFSDFQPYLNGFEKYLSFGLSIDRYQLHIDSIMWQEGPRLKMDLKLYPSYNAINVSSSHMFNASEVRRIWRMFTGWNVPDNDTFGPYELIDFPLPDLYKAEFSIPSSSGLSKGALAGVILGAVIVAISISVVVSLSIYKIYFRKQHRGTKGRLASKIPIKVEGVQRFTYGEMALATDNFSDSVQVGQGGYGKVYKGTLANGIIVAIKRAQEGSLQGEREFYTEIELLSRLHHRHLVSLLGYCDEEDEQMLVYEFMPNGNVRDHLMGSCKEPLNFVTRLRIALQSAKGILYLHTEADPPIFHRDIKASNILLDSNFTAKVADFGLSRLAPIPDVEGVILSHVSTVVKGTPGYLDPEYFLTHKLTDKSDVYSLGVVFLELLTGMQPISHGKNIVREVNMAFQSGSIYSVIDDRMGAYPSECVDKFMNLALRCCQDETTGRPAMVEVVRQLENISHIMLDLNSRITKSSTSLPTQQGTPTTLSPAMKNPYVSSDVSGSDLVSGVLPNVTSR